MKHMKLVVLFASALIIQPIHAGKKIDGIKKVGWCSWHLAQVLSGVIFADAVLVYPGKVWRAETKKNDSLKASIYFVSAITLLNDGIRGLNRELRVSEGVKKLTDRIRRKKQYS